MRWQVGIDAGSFKIKVVEGSERNGKLAIKKIGYFSNPFPEYKDTLSERERDIFVKELKSFLKKHRITTKKGILSTSGSGTIIHYFNIPDLPAHETESAIQLEMMQVVPGGLKNIEYDYTIIQDKNNKRIVFCVGYYKEKCEFLVSTMQMAGIKPFIMDYDGLAVLNCFNFLHKEREDTTFILNIGYKTTNLVLAENNSNGFVLTRDITFAGQNIINAIASDKNILTADAEIYGQKEESKNDVEKIVSSHISEFLYELRISIEYFKKQTEKTPQALFLTGGGSLFPGLSEVCEKEMKIQTTVWNPLEEMDTEEVMPLDLKSKGVLFGVSLGLVLRKTR